MQRRVPEQIEHEPLGRQRVGRDREEIVPEDAERCRPRLRSWRRSAPRRGCPYLGEQLRRETGQPLLARRIVDPPARKERVTETTGCS